MLTTAGTASPFSVGTGFQTVPESQTTGTSSRSSRALRPKAGPQATRRFQGQAWEEAWTELGLQGQNRRLIFALEHDLIAGHLRHAL